MSPNMPGEPAYILIFKPDSNHADIDFGFLTRQGIDIQFAGDKKTMIRMMQVKQAGAVIAFYESEQNSTIDFLRYIMRQHPDTQRIYLTSSLDKEVVEQVINKAHVNYLLTLPVETEHLGKIISKALKRYYFLVNPSNRYDDLAGITADLLGDVNKFRDEANRDSLTKLLNRRSFDMMLTTAVNQFRERSIPFSLAIMDLDNFKKLNDTYGHLAGDQVLRVFGQIITRNIRHEDSAFRYGGEEFAVITCGERSKQMAVIMGRLHQQVRRKKIQFENQQIRFAFSAGTAFMRDNYSMTQLIQSADAALYYAKKHGKDQVISYETIEPDL
ncbi:MAG: diguanylate cyclase [Calditrichales bacterium]|nr:MAG: diguanylate cyclase [Calditrichales bacterium]